MCGIVSYIGDKAAKDILLEGLKSLEYRGYDSSGIAVINPSNNLLEVTKTPGKIIELEKRIESLNGTISSSTCGIGHTRWATHGEPNERNAHPHTSLKNQDGSEVAIVHNGIIKNYLSIKKELESEGFKFNTDTDTEVIVKLFSQYRKESQQDLEALRKTIKKLEGSYAIAILCSDGNNNGDSKRKILVARNESPLVIGVGEGENFVASDSATVLQFTDKLVRLEDEQLAELTETEIKLEDIEGKKIRPTVHQLVKTSSLLEKGAYKHFLMKEIHEQPAVIRTMLSRYENNELDEQSNFENLEIDIKNLNRIVIVACGTAYHAGLVGKYLIESWAKVPVEAVVASEYANCQALLTKNDLVIGISQSGETADTLAAIKNAKDHGAQILCVTNKGDSALASLCGKNTFVTPAGTEISVAATKTFTAQATAMYLLALKLAEVRSTISEEEISSFKTQLHCLPQLIDQTIERSEKYKEEFIKYSDYRDFIFLSRGINYPIALEGALKLKELSYIHATGYASGEMKHGPIAILDHNVPVLNIAISGESEYEKNIYLKGLHNAEEAKARKSPSIVIACDDNEDVDSLFDTIIRIPNVSQLLSPIVATIPLQFLAYYIAEDLGKDVDQPRNLAKSVTVE